MFSKLQGIIRQWQGVLISVPAIAGLVIGANLTGALQGLELAAFDRFFLLRPQEQTDPRITIIGISDRDIDKLGKWPIDDASLAKLIEKINSYKPTAIGIDLYRNLPVKPGYQQLVKVFQSTPNLIGVEKAIGDPVAPPPALDAQDRVAMADLILDPDGKVRRALIAAQTEDGEIKLGLATQLALIYLQNQGIALENVPNSNNRRLGKALLVPITGNDGGYRHIDWGGYQVLLNFRGSGKYFKIISISDVLAGKVEPEFIRDRLVLIGSVAPSLNDYFYTPLSQTSQISVNRMAGVVVHANITSQIISGAIDGRPMLATITDAWEYLLVLGCSMSGAIVSFLTLQQAVRQKNFFASVKWLVICLAFPATTLFIGGYALFVLGWWIPVIMPMLAWTGAAVFSATYYSHQKQQLVFVDSLTQIGNRYSFDRFLDRQWWQNKQEQKPVSLILCDIDYFKVYNDTYGHQQGDDCLKQVASAFSRSVRAIDLVARYGGEEFAVILPNTNAETALQVAQRIRFAIKALNIPHLNSQASDRVSISCGIACLVPSDISSPSQLISIADRALYEAKKQGRDRATLADCKQ
jgi:diguanylate cyclase (GGDEF)-like protein